MRALTFFVLLLAAGSSLSQEPAMDWSAVAVKDIDSAYHIALDNHSGVFDPKNPGFTKQLNQARDRAQDLARQTRDSAGYVAAVSSFGAAMNDGHFSITTNLPANELPKRRWPGFFTAWRGDRLLVMRTTTGGPSVGARVMSCDGIPINALIERNVFAFTGRSGEAGQWWLRAWQVFIDAANPFVNLPLSCAFQTARGPETKILTWTALSDNAYEERRALASGGDGLPIGLTQPEPRFFWIAMPTFAPDADGQAAYDKLLADMATMRVDVLRARAVVLDLRHNGGGSSDWSYRVAKALWGDEIVGAKMNEYFRGVTVRWRATPGNADDLADLIKSLQGQSDSEETVKSLETIEALMRRAVTNQEHFVTEPTSDDSVAAAKSRSDFSRPVYVIVPGGCASACLDALDVFSRFPQVKLIGAPSSADSTYLEVRFAPLPSGNAKLVFPMKIWVNRPRASGEIYKPNIEVDDLDWSTATFLKRIQKDLGER
jgi:Peptidase family S41